MVGLLFKLSPTIVGGQVQRSAHILLPSFNSSRLGVATSKLRFHLVLAKCGRPLPCVHRSPSSGDDLHGCRGLEKAVGAPY